MLWEDAWIVGAFRAAALNSHDTKQDISVLSWQELIDGFLQEKRNSSVLAMELRLSRTNPWVGARKT